MEELITIEFPKVVEQIMVKAGKITPQAIMQQTKDACGAIVKELMQGMSGQMNAMQR